MPNIFIEIGDGVEVSAKDLAQFFARVGRGAEALVSPQALLGFAVLLSAVGPVVVDATAAAAQDGLNIPLDIETAELIIQTWPALKIWANTMPIKAAKGKPS